MKVIIHFKTFMLLILVLFALISCKEDFKVYPIGLDVVDIGDLEEELYIQTIDFRYLERGNINFNELVFTLKPLNKIRKGNQKMKLDESSKVDIWLTYKNKKYKTFQQFLSIHNMYEGQPFSVECSIEFMDTTSELYSFFDRFDQYNTKEKIKKLKQEIPKMQLFVYIEDEIIEVPITNKTEVVYTKIPIRMKSVLIMDYD